MGDDVFQHGVVGPSVCLVGVEEVRTRRHPCVEYPASGRLQLVDAHGVGVDDPSDVRQVGLGHLGLGEGPLHREGELLGGADH